MERQRARVECPSRFERKCCGGSVNVTPLSLPLVHYREYYSDVIMGRREPCAVCFHARSPSGFVLRGRGRGEDVIARRTRCHCRICETTREEKVILCQGDS